MIHSRVNRMIQWPKESALIVEWLSVYKEKKKSKEITQIETKVNFNNSHSISEKVVEFLSAE